MVSRPSAAADRVILLILAAMWLVNGIGYHVLHVAPINPAARVFAVLVVLKAVLLAAAAFRPRDRVIFEAERGSRSWLAATLILFAMLLYPALGFLFGHRYAIVQTITFSYYLYSAEIYPTRLRALGTGFGSALPRLGSFAGPMVVGFITAQYGIGTVFAAVLVLAAIVTGLCAIETKGRVSKARELRPRALLLIAGRAPLTTTAVARWFEAASEVICPA